MKHAAAAARALIQSPALVHYGMPSITINARGADALRGAIGLAAGLPALAQEAASAFLAWPEPAASVRVEWRGRSVELRAEHFDFTTPGGESCSN